jgi:hypothetical protein
MDMAQVFDVGWAFFASWGMVLAAVSIIAFGRDIFPFPQQSTPEQKHRR